MDRDPLQQDKPLPTTPRLTPNKTGAIENIPRNRAGPSTASELIRRVSSIFTPRKKRPTALSLSPTNVSKIYESPTSSAGSLIDEEDDIRRPSGLGSAASISSNRSLPPSPFTPAHDRDPSLNPHTPFGYIRARATSTPNLLRSLSLRSRGSKVKPRTRGSSTSRTGSQIHLRSNTVTLASIPAETIALVFSYLPKSDLAQIARTCRLFLSASRTVLYTHINLGELPKAQLEKLVAVLSIRRDFTDLVRTFTCETWPTFFLPTSTLPSTSPSSSSASPASPSTSSTSARLSILLEPSHDPDLQHRNTLLTATFTLAFQRMSNLISLTLPSYDHDLLAHHTAFGLRTITFSCSMLSKEDVNEMFAWLDGQTNITTLLFPRLVQEFDYGASDESRSTTVARSASVSAATRPLTSNGLLAGQGQGKDYLGPPYLVPLPSASPRTSKPPTLRPNPRLSPRPKSAAPASPSYATFAAAAIATATSSSPEGSGQSSPSPSSSSQSYPQIPFPTSADNTKSSQPTATTTTTPAYNPPSPHFTNTQPQPQYSTSPPRSPTLLPNLTNLHGPPSLIIALASPTSSTSHSQGTWPYTRRQRPLRVVHLNITSTLYSGLRPATIMTGLVGVTRHLGLYFGESVDRRSVEKVLGAAGSALGGERARERDAENEGKDKEGLGRGAGYKFGEGEWKGLVQLDVGFVAGGPGSDEALHKMISSAIPRYPYLRALRLTYIAATTTHHALPFPSHHTSTSNLVPTPSSSISPLPLTPNGNGTSPILTPTFSSASSMPTTPIPDTKGEKNGKGKDLTPPEQAYIRQWTKHCPDMQTVVFLDGAEWRKKSSSV